MGREDHEVKINAIAKTLDLADMGRSDAVPLPIRAVIYQPQSSSIFSPRLEPDGVVPELKARRWSGRRSSLPRGLRKNDCRSRHPLELFRQPTP